MAYDRTLLSEEEVAAFLAAHPFWRREGQELCRTYEFPSFPEGVAFVQRVAEVAERHDHHPDIEVRYRKVTLRLCTHDAGGLTFRDPQVADECDRAFGKGG
ncbi:MAG: 4a-hydroxytetrahydrobiopterin dehydratase [Myxococcota bacterium]